MNLLYVFSSLCCVWHYGMGNFRCVGCEYFLCTVRFVECDLMVSVLLNVWICRRLCVIFLFRVWIYPAYTFRCVEFEYMLSVLSALLSVNLWYMYVSLCCLWHYAVFNFRCVDCDLMVCVLIAVLSVTLLYKYSSLRWVWPYVVCNVRYIVFDMMCIRFTV